MASRSIRARVGPHGAPLLQNIIWISMNYEITLLLMIKRYIFIHVYMIDNDNLEFKNIEDIILILMRIYGRKSYFLTLHRIKCLVHV